MASAVKFELDLPDDLDRFQLPPGVQARLQSLLDQQDREGSLSDSERLEAEGLVNLADLLALLDLLAGLRAGSAAFLARASAFSLAAASASARRLAIRSRLDILPAMGASGGLGVVWPAGSGAAL